MSTLSPEIKSHVFAAKLAILASLTTAGLFLVGTENVVLIALGILLLGAMYAHAVELQHQCLHYTAFSARSLNRIVGILLGLPTLTSFHAYRRSHLDHHRNLGTPSDKPFFNYRFINSGSFGDLLYDLFGAAHLKASLSAIFGQSDARLIAVPSSAEPGTLSEKFDCGLMAFLIACTCLYTMGFASAFAFKAWFLPLILVAQPIHLLIELPEHIGCVPDSTDSLRNTRTIVGSRFSRWFTNSNNLHVEHHQAMALSMDQLHSLFEENRGKHQFLVQTYFEFYKSLVQKYRPTANTIVTDRTARRPA